MKEAMSDKQPTSPCPQCKAEVPDFDGFGVLAHDACGYCSHPAMDQDEHGRWLCGICGKEKSDE